MSFDFPGDEFGLDDDDFDDTGLSIHDELDDPDEDDYIPDDTSDDEYDAAEESTFDDIVIDEDDEDDEERDALELSDPDYDDE